jgi:type II secretory pathway pseudopilin PulG
VTRRASILLEVLLAIAVFAFAGVVVLGVLQETVAATERAERAAAAMDLARTRLAEIETGMGANAPDRADDGTAARDASGVYAGLRVEDRLEPSDHEGLDLAVVEVWDDAAPAPSALARALGTATNDPPRRAVLRQLVPSARPGGARPRPEFNR